MTPRLMVISDIHIGSGPLDDCDGELQQNLVDFLSAEAARSGPSELVINGDFLDFAQAAPWGGPELEDRTLTGLPLCFTQEQSQEKLGTIVAAHRPVFDALGEYLAADAAHKLTILPGNHDADFFWGAVRDGLMGEVAKHSAAVRERIHFHLENGYSPASHPWIWIEHGHQHDVANRFFVEEKPFWSAENPPIFPDRSGIDRLLECAGTLFMIRFMNRLDLDYPFVDNVKPFSRFFQLFGASMFTSRSGPLKAAVALAWMGRFLGGSAHHNWRELLSVEGADTSVGSFKEFLQHRLTQAEQARLARKLADAGLAIDRPLAMYLDDQTSSDELIDFLSTHLELLEEFEKDDGEKLGATPGTLSLGKAFRANDSEILRGEAARVCAGGPIRLVIMGHTHEPVDEPSYKNLGSWTRYYRLEKKEKLRPFSVLKNNSYEQFPYEQNFGEVSVENPEGALTRFRSRSKDG